MSLFDFLRGAQLREKVIINSRQIVKALSVYIGERSFETPANLARSASFIHSAFALHGRSVREEKFSVGDLKLSNIVAELPGRSKKKGSIIIGAHYDSVRGTTGANDNATGIAALLELHRLLAKEKLGRSVRFCAFVLEEPPFFGTEDMGSFVHAKRAKKRGDKIDLMVSLDMLGYGGRFVKQSYPTAELERKYQSKGNFLAVATVPSQHKYASLWRKVYNRHTSRPAPAIVAPGSVQGVINSDHYSFIQHGYPAVMVTDTGFYRNKNYHTEDDTFATVNYRFLGYNILTLFKTIRDLSNHGHFPK